MKATDFLRKGADLLEERGKQYDQPGGERSMGKAVGAFNIITGRDLTEAEGWLLLQILKDVRQWQNPDVYHADSAEDCVSYAALKAEALASFSEKAGALGVAAGDLYADSDNGQIEPASLIDDESPRAAILGQNGEMAEEVYSAMDGAPSWDGAPECAVMFIDWQDSCIKPAFYADGGDRFFAIHGGVLTDYYVPKTSLNGFHHPVYFRPHKDAK